MARTLSPVSVQNTINHVINTLINTLKLHEMTCQLKEKFTHR